MMRLIIITVLDLGDSKQCILERHGPLHQIYKLYPEIYS